MMDMIKRHLSLIIPGTVVLVSVVFIALAFLTSGAVKGQMEDESGRLSKQVKGMKSSPISSRQPEVEKTLQDRHEGDARKIEEIVYGSTMRELISYQIFPKPTDTSRQIFDNFGPDYRAAIEALVDKVGGRDAPSDNEISTATVNTSSRKTVRGSNDTSPVIDALCARRAQTANVYASAELFKWYQLWEDYSWLGQDAAIDDCWYSQIAYWVYEDIIDTIAAVNEGSSSVLTSPVKRLYGISFSSDASEMKPNRKTVESDIPVYVTDVKGSPLGSEPWTQRKTDKQKHVIHFSVSFIVEVDKVPDLMSEICSAKSHVFKGWKGRDKQKDLKHNQITILNVSSSPVDTTAQDHEYYRYGNKPVVQLTAVCEYLFVSKSFSYGMPQGTSIVPETIEEVLGLDTEN